MKKFKIVMDKKIKNTEIIDKVIHLYDDKEDMIRDISNLYKEGYDFLKGDFAIKDDKYSRAAIEYLDVFEHIVIVLFKEAEGAFKYLELDIQRIEDAWEI
jgi:hypothetical protein